MNKDYFWSYVGPDYRKFVYPYPARTVIAEPYTGKIANGIHILSLESLIILGRNKMRQDFLAERYTRKGITT